MIIKESTERSDRNNWVKSRLLQDEFKIIDFEGYTIMNEKVTGLFDRRLFIQNEIDFSKLSEDDVLEIIEREEPYLSAKVNFSNILDTHYRYVFYSYEPEYLYVYRFEDNILKFKAEFDNFCTFINYTRKIRDLAMISPLEETDMPNIDHILRNRCGYAWMGNLDGLFLSENGDTPKALVEFQTTNKISVKDHCNNTWFAPRNGRKGDEQRWKVFDTLSKQSKLPLVIIVWSPNEVDGDIKYKVVKEIIYSDDKFGREPGITYCVKDVIDYDELVQRLNLLINE